MRPLHFTFVILMAAATMSLVMRGNAATAGGDHRDPEHAPYEGQQTREIKALSPQEIDDYLRGSGMGYAKAAELNHYPGPRHVLDLADELELTAAQAEQTEWVFRAMQSAAIVLGERLVALEKQLDSEFASQSTDEASIHSLLNEIGAVEAELRFVHLSAHLKQKALLSLHQVHRYDQLRGYGANGKGTHSHRH